MRCTKVYEEAICNVCRNVECFKYIEFVLSVQQYLQLETTKEVWILQGTLSISICRYPLSFLFMFCVNLPTESSSCRLRLSCLHMLIHKICNLHLLLSIGKFTIFTKEGSLPNNNIYFVIFVCGRYTQIGGFPMCSTSCHL